MEVSGGNKWTLLDTIRNFFFFLFWDLLRANITAYADQSVI